MRDLFKVYLVSCLVLSAGCHQNSSHSLDNPRVNTRAIIFVPGFKGSKLVDENHKLIWISPVQSFFNLSSLALPVNGVTLSRASLNLKAEEILNDVPLLWGLYSYPVYGAFVSLLQKDFPDYQVFSFAYDWRGDLAVSAAQLGAYVESLRAQGYSDITVVAHSLGGLVSAHYLLSAVEKSKVSKIAFIAAPFRGALTIFRDMQVGIGAFLNRSLLSREALGTFPSSYQLFPPVEVSSLFDNEQLFSTNLYDSKMWDEMKLGLLNTTKQHEARLAFTQEQLNRARLLSSKLNDEGAIKLTIPILNISNGDAPTLSGARVDSTNKIFNFNKSEDEWGIHVLGDGIVTKASATLPPFLSNGREVEIHGSHWNIIYSKETADELQSFVRGVPTP